MISPRRRYQKGALVRKGGFWDGRWRIERARSAGHVTAPKSTAGTRTIALSEAIATWVGILLDRGGFDPDNARQRVLTPLCRPPTCLGRPESRVAALAASDTAAWPHAGRLHAAGLLPLSASEPLRRRRKTTVETCDYCGREITPEEAALEWPISTAEGLICPSCFGDEAFCCDCGETLIATSDTARCPACESEEAGE